MKKYYDVGIATASLEKLPSGLYHLVIIESGQRLEWNFKTELGAFKELLSYAEVDADWFDGKEQVIV